MIQNKTPITFNFYTFHFEPYREYSSTHNTRSILKSIFQYIREEKKEQRTHVIDRFKNRDGNESRELFMWNSRFMNQEDRIICSLALFRKDRVPKLMPKNTVDLRPIKDIGSIAEETRFVIDLSTNKCIICAEYNHYGPRWTDLEFYLRNTANNEVLGLAKHTTMNVMFDSTLDYTIQNFANILHLDIKAKPSSIKHLDSNFRNHYFSGMTSIGDQLKPKSVRMEAFFQTRGKSINTINSKANIFVGNILNDFRKKKRNIEHFEGFQIKYENKSGEEKYFDLLKGKKAFTKEIDLKSNPNLLTFYGFIKDEISHIISML